LGLIIGISFKFKQDADPQIVKAVQEGQATMLDAYNCGQAIIVNTSKQFQFQNSPVYNHLEHDNLLHNLEHILDNANISIEALCTSCRGFVSEQEIAQVYHYGLDPRGLIYTGDSRRVQADGVDCTSTYPTAQGCTHLSDGLGYRSLV
jgi:hypothetical protein